LKTSDFYYHLPREYIAQHPLEPRDSSRLLVYTRKTGSIEHSRFFHLVDYLEESDLLVINRTRVIQARLMGKKIPTGGKIELLLLRDLGDNLWEAMAGGQGIKVGGHIQIENGPEALVEVEEEGPLRQIRFLSEIGPLLDDIGQVPLPPYIQATLPNPERYQTIFAAEKGSAAAPTAGLHFTEELLQKIRSQGIGIVDVTLHIGLDTFAPVHEQDPEHHKIHKEWCSLPLSTAEAINQTRRKGGRIIAVGTTSVRVLETAARCSPSVGEIVPFEGETDLFILPGFEFQVVDCLLTNFHLPESTLIMLVSAFAGRERILDLYRLAIEEGYRFYSFGDAMLLL
jgi:S-adenosylmethionine:tRNA ribosyltransferase-isomerase